ncbi:MAG: hypothetical protein V1885_03615 [Candidatus Brennerbacteria bacterium]
MKRPDGTNGQNGQNGIEALAKLLGDSEHIPRYRGAHIRFQAINVLPQPRKTFESISELALDIAEKGQLNPLIVARFDTQHYGRYLEVINRLWGTSFSLKDAHSVREKGKAVFYVLLAGERRYRSMKLLREKGYEALHRTVFGNLPVNVRALPKQGDTIEVRLCDRTSPLFALYVQLSENTHMQVPPHEEAHAYSLLFRLVRQADESYSIAQFARRIGRSPETVRNALRFFELPVGPRSYVERGALPYGIGVELTRLHRIGLKARELDWWAMRAITGRKKVPDFHDLISRYLTDQTSEQMTLLDIMDGKNEALVRRMHIRKTVQAHLVRAVWGYAEYFRKVLGLFEEGKLGKEDSPFSVRSPIRAFLSLIGILERLLPHLRGLISHAKHGHATEVLGRARELASQAERYAEEDGPISSH